VIFHQTFPDKLIKFKLFNYDKMNFVFFDNKWHSCREIKFFKVSTNNFLVQKWKKWAKKLFYLYYYPNLGNGIILNMWILSIRIYFTKKWHLIHAISQIWEAENTIFCFAPIFSGRRKYVLLLENTLLCGKTFFKLQEWRGAFPSFSQVNWKKK